MMLVQALIAFAVVLVTISAKGDLLMMLIVVLLVILAVLLLIWAIYPRLAKSKQQSPSLPSATTPEVNKPLTPEGRELVVKEIRAGRKPSAIKIYRDLTGASLADAKAAVESLEG